MKVRNFLHILAVSAALAAYSAWVSCAREKDISQSGAVDVFPGTDIPLLNVAEAEVLWRKKSTLFIDVRPYPDYEFGHIQGAMSLPWEEFEDRYPALKPQLDAAEAIVIYCKSADCGKSYYTALSLRQRGLKQSKIYPNGWYEWCEHKLPITGQGS
jgi:rhodanese-related sulfurtransferase